MHDRFERKMEDGLGRLATAIPKCGTRVFPAKCGTRVFPAIPKCGTRVFPESSRNDSGRLPQSPWIEVVVGGSDGQNGSGRDKTVVAGLGKIEIRVGR
jgi:hypothetical protein